MGSKLFDSAVVRGPREAVDFITNILESSTEYSIIGMDLEGKILLWNEGARRIYGYEPDEVVGHSNAEILYNPAGVAHGKPREILDIVLRSGKWEGTLNRVRKNGQSFTARVVITPRRDAGGKPTGFLLISKDISSEIHLTEELKAAQFYTRSLIESNIDALMTTDPLGVITDVNRQMCEITGHSREELIGPPFKDYFTDPKRAEDAIRKVLTGGRVTNYELTIKASDGRESVVSYNATTFRGTYGRLQGVFAQVLLNLVSNALKYTAQGEVTVSARRAGADRFAIEVKDTGIGIPPEVQERIFEAFYQVDCGYTRKVGGTGLGLSIVRELTTLLGGKIELTSAPGQGSTFTVILPIKAVDHQQQAEPYIPRLHPAQQAPTNSPSSAAFTSRAPNALFEGIAAPEASEGQQQVVLAVDDNPDVIVLITTALQDTPYTVVGVQDPLQMMGLAQAMQPCAITLDVMMPDLNGWQLLHLLRTDPTTASIPVVMLTVLSEPSTDYILGADDYLIKPFQKDALITTLQRLIAPRKAPSHSSELEAQTVSKTAPMN